MADINAAFVIEDGLAFDETQTGIFAGVNDPRVGGGEPAPVGSLFLRNTGELFIKTGAADTAWQFILREPDITFDGLAPTTTKGDLIVRAVSGNVRLAVGSDNYVLVADAAQPTGVKWAPQTSAVIANDTGEPTGFVDRTQSIISFDNGSLTFTIAPVSTSFDVYVKGIKYTKTAAESLTIPNSTGLYFFYYQVLGTFAYSTSFFDLSTCAPVALVYWNAISGEAALVGEERHGITMDWATHKYLHETHGAMYKSGFALKNFTLTGTGTSNADSQVALDGGTFYDEDLSHTVVDAATPASIFEQTLSPIAKIPGSYKLNSNIWYKDPATLFPLKYSVSNGPYFNENVGGTWQLTQTSTSHFIASWVVATNDINNPVMFILGQRQDSSLSQAQLNNTWANLDLIGLPDLEMRPLWLLIFEHKSTFTNTPRTRLAAAIDYRTADLIGSGEVISQLPPVDHGSLTGLTDDDHPQYVHVSIARTISAQHQFAPTAPQTPFTLGANAQGQLVTGLNADLLDGQHATAFQPIDADLTAISALSGTGIAARTAADTWALRQLVQPAQGITIANPTGAGGNPTFALANDLLAVENIPTFGLAVRTATSTWSTRTILGSTGRIVISDGDGIASNPIIDLDLAGTAGTYTKVTTDIYGRVTAGQNPTTLAGYGITDAQPLAPQLTSISNLLGTGFIVLTGGGNAIERNIVGTVGNIDVTNPDGVLGNTTINLVTTGVTPGTYGSSTNSASVAVDSFGRITAASNVGIAFPVTSVFGRTGAVTAAEGDYYLTQLADVLISSPTAGQWLTYTGSTWTNTTPPTLLTDPTLNGIVIRTAAGVTTARTLQAGAGISITNADGTGGDPTITNTGVTSLTGTPNQVVVSAATGNVTLSVGTELAGLATLTTTGFVERTGLGTYTTRTIKLYSENPTTGQATATGNDAVAIGDLAQAQAARSLAIGAHAVTRTPGAINAAAGRIQSSGDAQGGTYYLKAVTTNALAKELFMDGPSGTQRAVLADDSTWMFTIHLTAHCTTEDGHAGWFIKGVIYRGAGAATTALQGRAHVEVVAKSNPTWDINIGVNTVDGGLAIVATGEAGKTIRWLARLETAELTN